MPPAVALLACALASGIAVREALAVQRATGLVLLLCTSVVLVVWGWRRRVVMGVAALRVIAVAGVPDPAGVTRLDRAPPPPSMMRRTAGVIAGWRVFLLGRVAAHLDGERRALVDSLVLGERGEVSESLDDAFRVA